MKKSIIFALLMLTALFADQNSTSEKAWIDESHGWMSKKVLLLSHHLDQRLSSYSDYFWENNTSSEQNTEDRSSKPGNIGTWFSGFFEDELFDEAYTKSYASVKTTLSYDHKRDDFDQSASLRLYLALPKISERLHFYIDNREESIDGRYYDAENQGSVGFRYILEPVSYFNSSFSVGLHSFENPYARAYFWIPFTYGKWHNRFMQKVKYSHDDELEDESSFYFDRFIEDDAMFRIHVGRRNSQYLNEVPEKGDFYFGTLSYSKTTKYNSGYKIGVSTMGRYKPEFEETQHSLFVIYKQNIWKKWLYYEIEPRVEWEDTYDFEPNYVVLFSLQIYFGDDFTPNAFRELF